MFEKVKRGVKKVKSNVRQMKARSQGLTVAELERKESFLRKKKQDEQLKYESYKIEENYRQKKKRYSERGGGGGLLDAVTGMGKNVLKNVETTPTSNFNNALTGKTGKKKKRKKRRIKKVVYY